MFDDAWWDGDDEGDAIAELQRVLAPLREAPRPWGDVIAQARFVAPNPTSRRSLVAVATVGLAAALVLGWQLGRRDAESDTSPAPIEEVPPAIPVAEPVVVIGPAADLSPGLARSRQIVDAVLQLDAMVEDEERLAAQRELEESIERNETLKAVLQAKREAPARKHEPHDDLVGVLEGIERKRTRPQVGERVQDDELPDTLTTNDIKIAMNRVKPAAKACLVKHKAAKGEMVKIKLSIDGTTGRPTSVNAQDHAGTALGECVVVVVRTARFPRFRKPALGVIYPFVL